jgi:hypothetical protein
VRFAAHGRPEQRGAINVGETIPTAHRHHTIDLAAQQL